MVDAKHDAQVQSTEALSVYLLTTAREFLAIQLARRFRRRSRAGWDHIRGFGRAPDTGYGSGRFQQACRISTACRKVEGSGARATWRRLRAGSPLLTWYRLRLPSTRVRVTTSPAGRMISQHLGIREQGRWRFRDAQGVLPLPTDFSDYMRGRHRQAVRTNVGHAHRAGLTVEWRAEEGWLPGLGDFRLDYITPGPIERWNVVRPDGVVTAQAILSVDGDVALLHGLVSYVPDTKSRWLLHTAIVERLCGNCSVMLINSGEAYLMNAGTQHFQRLLGYRVARLRLAGQPRRAPVARMPARTSAT